VHFHLTTAFHAWMIGPRAQLRHAETSGKFRETFAVRNQLGSGNLRVNVC
jgi:hypothetical protein